MKDHLMTYVDQVKLMDDENELQIREYENSVKYNKEISLKLLNMKEYESDLFDSRNSKTSAKSNSRYDTVELDKILVNVQNKITNEDGAIAKLESEKEENQRNYEALTNIYSDMKNSIRSKNTEIHQLTNQNDELKKKCSFIEERLSIFQKSDDNKRRNTNTVNIFETTCKIRESFVIIKL